MADVKTDISKLQADLATIKTGLAGLNSQIQTLNDKLNAGTTLSADDAAALDQLASDADNLASQFPAPAPPAPTA